MNTHNGQGFILTKKHMDVNGGVELTFWLCTETGPVKIVVPNEEVVFFIEEQQLEEAITSLKRQSIMFRSKNLALKTFNLKNAIGLYFQTNSAAVRAHQLLKKQGIQCYEADVKLCHRFLMERFIYGSMDFSGDSLRTAPFQEIHLRKARPSSFQPNLNIISLDIECSFDGDLYSVGIYAKKINGDELKYVIMIGDEELSESWMIWAESEVDLLLKMVDLINHLDPDIIIGWNVIEFDFRILIQRAEKLGIQLHLGRDRSVATWWEGRGGQKFAVVEIAGRILIDGIDALKSATYNFSSFSLDHVAKEILGRGKKVDDVNFRMNEIDQNFLHDKIKLAVYNLEDCILVWEIFSQLDLVPFLVYRSQITGLELNKLGGSVAAFYNLYLPRIHRIGYVAPNISPEDIIAGPGGYVMDSIPGLYKNIVVLDFKSLYPSIIMTFKIDPVGMIEGLRNQEDSIEGFEGAKFSREKHCLPEIIQQLWMQRDIAKKNKQQARSQAIKIIMNSFYGVLASNVCRFSDSRLASSITMRGHQILRQTATWIESMGYEVIYGDTDSIFIALPPILNHEQCCSVALKIQENINTFWRDEILDRHRLVSRLEIQFDSHYSRFLMPTIRGSELGSKKRYAGLEHTITNGKILETLVFKGLESVRTDWTDLAKFFQRELYDCIFHDHDPTEIVNKFIRETRGGFRDAELIYRKRLRRSLELYRKNLPPHVKAARLADQMNKQLNRPLRYQNKGQICYVITLNGPEPIEYQAHKIDYEHYIEKQLWPVAEAILPLVGVSFNACAKLQMELF